MSQVQYPAHKLCFISIEGKPALLVAKGTSILSLSFPHGEQVSIWPRDDGEESNDEDEENGKHQDERPSKRQKLSDSGKPGVRRHDSETSEASIEIVAEGQKRQKGERRRPKIPDLTLSHVSHLTATSDGKHAIAITSEDKTVRVFSITRKGRLRQISARSMPKKCCAIKLTADEKTILTADKFGDVYGIPLHPKADYKPTSDAVKSDDVYKPSASELTVHTKGNLDALKQQQMQKSKQAKKEGPAFQHKLLLGHVSLLTDLVTAQGLIEGKQRGFILTSDRDEHIRVSRTIPQTHVIHSFCLGHSEFVSKLCIVPWDQQVLVAGNGEPSLRVYDWQKGLEQSRFAILEQLRPDVESVLPETRGIDKLAVSGIWPVRLQDAASALIVALEGLPLLFSFKLSGFELLHMQTLKLDLNVLDVFQSHGQDILAVAVDTAHETGSYKYYRTDKGQSIPAIHFFNLRHAEMIVNETTVDGLYLERSDSLLPWQIDGTQQDPSCEKAASREADAKTKDYERAYSTVGEFIYGLENLRKRRGRAVEEDEDAEGQADEAEPEEGSEPVQ